MKNHNSEPNENQIETQNEESTGRESLDVRQLYKEYLDNDDKFRQAYQLKQNPSNQKKRDNSDSKTESSLEPHPSDRREQTPSTAEEHASSPFGETALNDQNQLPDDDILENRPKSNKEINSEIDIEINDGIRHETIVNETISSKEGHSMQTLGNQPPETTEMTLSKPYVHNQGNNQGDNDDENQDNDNRGDNGSKDLVQSKQRQKKATLNTSQKAKKIAYTPEQDVQMSFVEHLEELRKHFIRSLLIFGLFTIAALTVSGFLVEFLQMPYTSLGKNLITTRPTGAFLTRLKVSLMTALIASLPFVLHQIWLFVFPALSGRLRKMGMPLMFFAFILFGSGVAFNYFIVLPLVLEALMNIAWEGVEIIYNIDDYYDFITMTSIVFGAIFELPVIVLVFVRAGLMTHHFLLKNWRMALLVGAIIAAILTPPDAFSQLLMLAPMVILYLVSIVIAFVFRIRD